MSSTVQEGTSAVPRRKFLKWSAAAGGTTALVGAGAYFGMLPGIGAANAATATSGQDVDKTVWNSCNVNCGSRCPLRMQVKDGHIVRVLPDNTGDDELGSQQIRACVRGRAIRQRIYNPDRLKAPMRRKAGATRGAGEFEEITWEEAFDTIASELKRVIDTYGNEAVFYHYGSGSTGGNITKRGTWPRLLNCTGGYLAQYGDYSTAQITGAYPYHYGAFLGSNSLQDAKHAELQVMFGNNPLETRMSGGGESFVTQQTKKLHNVRTIVIDPRYSETALAVGDQWVAIRPGTDAALVAGIAHVMISEDLHDQAFLDEYCVGFDEDHMPEGIPAGNSYKSYILGEGPDGVEKTPAWAARITGTPAATITRLAREIAGAKPCAITQGWGPQRSANGENHARAIFTLAALTGNIGIPGGGNGGREGFYTIPLAKFPLLENPVTTAISCFSWTDAIDHGPEMTATRDGVRGKEKLDVGIKFLVNNASNTLINQHADSNRTAKLLEDESKCEFILVVDNQMTASAKFADILLPDTTNIEQSDVIPNGWASEMGYLIMAEKVIEPLFSSRTGYDMCTEIARRMGVEKEFTEGRTQEEWITHLLDKTRDDIPDLPSENELWSMGVYRKQNPQGTTVSMKAFREDPVANPLETPSGKVEIFSKPLWEMSKTWELPEGDRITALPEHVATWEGAEEAKANTKYPLQCIGHHYKSRTHSSYGNVAWLKEAHPQVVWINPSDAAARGIANDDVVQVFNDRGRIELVARVTPRIAPGVVSVPQGAWYTPNSKGVDVGGNVNTLTSWRPSPLAKGNAQHTTLVNVEKA
ncbi:DMSO/selenate family reductase complex A subunit [Georgenia yuyongxinii]|uniref:Molybdopterin-dependent oxidoreductase n=1 Tax=Georgenia yuyongxinii TaxID=2589797 RepID=A0A552WMN0_9MICO|nr:DMSO/selenate family reductase complex A subunit [Georgenia yuyongxinii]TRW43839.1 molybdopterin-dependent oxidoreductase [Georgenia yuyongxinii]